MQSSQRATLSASYERDHPLATSLPSQFAIPSRDQTRPLPASGLLAEVVMTPLLMQDQIRVPTEDLAP
jgi:hypothetical protein